MSNIQASSEELLKELSAIIEKGKQQAVSRVNSVMILVYWQVGKRIQGDILQNTRAEYGKQIIANLAKSLTRQYGKSFQERNLRRMLQFVEIFADERIVSTLSTQLSWSHFVELLSIPSEEARLFYAQKIAKENWSVRRTRHAIERKEFEREAIASTKSALLSTEQTFFKDPYFLDFLNLKEGFLENELETAILKDLELFILELGLGFTFVERQKRMIIGGEDFYLDLLFYHRRLKRLVAIELKIGKFKAAYKGQMELYLKWLNKHDKQEGEESPIGLILCAEASQEQVELLEVHKDDIMVAEYWTELPPKAELERRLQKALTDARERIARLKSGS